MKRLEGASGYDVIVIQHPAGKPRTIMHQARRDRQQLMQGRMWLEWGCGLCDAGGASYGHRSTAGRTGADVVIL